MDSFADFPDPARMTLAATMQIPDLIAALQDALNASGRHAQRAASLSGSLALWHAAEPETRAAALLNLAWAARDALSLPRPPDREAEGYALALADLARAAGTWQAFHGPDFPAMPLRGQGGIIASSLAFDRDDLPVSLETAMVLLASIPEPEKETGESDAIEGVILPVEKSVNEWGGTTYTWTCPKCKGEIKSHTSDKEKAIAWIAKYAPHISCGESGESDSES